MAGIKKIKDISTIGGADVFGLLKAEFANNINEIIHVMADTLDNPA